MPQPVISVLAGPSLDSLTPLTVNSSEPHSISSPSSGFSGRVAVRIVDYLGPEGVSQPKTELKDGATMSIVVQGKWEEEVEADEVMFGNCWANPIRDSLPYGTSAALKFVKFVDPTLDHNVYSDTPWALSPFLATMNYVSATEATDNELPPFNPTLVEDLSILFDPPETSIKGNVAARKKLLNDSKTREKLRIEKGVVIESDFCNGYINFKTLSLKLPGGLSFALESYWDGQPVTFVCRNRSGSKNYFFITWQIVREGEEENKVQKKGEESKEEDGPSEGQDVDGLGVD